MRTVFFLLFSFLSFQFAFADQSEVPLYKIEKDGRVAYLLGTIHSGVNFSSLPENISLKFLESSSLIVEVDIEAATPLVRASFPIGGEDSLKDQLTKQEWDRFYSHLAPIYGDSAHLLNRLHPTVATLSYMMSVLPPTSQPIDLTLMEMAKTQNKKIFYLDTPEIQVEALSKTQTIETLRNSLAISNEEFKLKLDRIVQLYISGDLRTLNEEMHDSMSPLDHLYILEKRNLSWISQFDELFARPGKEFFAVGAGHLFGEFGLIPLLKSKGYLISGAE